MLPIKSLQSPVLSVAIIILSASPLTLCAAALSYAIPPVFPISPVVKTQEGAAVAQVKPGSQMMIEAGASPSTALDNPMYIVIIVRDKDGATLQLTWQSVYLSKGNTATVGMSWLVPDNAQPQDVYVIRCMVIQSVAAGRMEALSEVYQTQVAVR